MLDRLLADAAVEAGAELREGVTVEGLLMEDGRVVGVAAQRAAGVLSERARVVIGADGRNSIVAREAGAAGLRGPRHAHLRLLRLLGGRRARRRRALPAPRAHDRRLPTHDGRNVVIVLWPQDEFETVRADIEGAFEAAVALAPGLAARLRAGAPRGAASAARACSPTISAPPPARAGRSRATPATTRTRSWRSGSATRSVTRTCWPRAIEAGGAGAPTARAATRSPGPGFESTVAFAALQPPSAEQQALFAVLREDQALTDRFFGTFAGTVAPGELFSPAGAAAGP